MLGIRNWLLMCRSPLALIALLVLAGGSASAESHAAGAKPLPVASVHFEQNATDGDVEVVFKAKGGDEGLARLTVVSPDGRTVIDFTAPDKSTLGIRQFQMESPEPKDVSALKTAYREGEYKFAAQTFSGHTLTGISKLSHRLPPTAQFAIPSPEAKNVPTSMAAISWRPVQDVVHFIVEIEQDDLGTRVEATLPGDSTTFRVPEGFLMPGMTYQLAIGTVGATGNISFVETTFTTRD